MADNLGAPWARAWITAAASEVAVSRARLSELDRAIGDGDHGENLDRGFKAARAGLDHAATSPSEVFAGVARALISTVGGAAGPLYGTAFLRASSALVTKAELGGADIAELLAAALRGIQDRGKAVAGEKTMVDAWQPAVAAANEIVAAGGSAAEVLRAAATAAAHGAEATEPLVATKGRASYLGERAIGHRDPGAESSAIILAAAAAAAEGAA